MPRPVCPSPPPLQHLPGHPEFFTSIQQTSVSSSRPLQPSAPSGTPPLPHRVNQRSSKPTIRAAVYISLYVDVNTFIGGRQPQNKLMRIRTFKKSRPPRALSCRPFSAPSQRARPARKSARGGVGDRSPRPHPPNGERAAPSQVGGNGTGPPPPKQAKRSTGPRPDTRSHTDRVERPYQRAAPGPHEVRAPHQPGEGGGRGRRKSASAHTHKGHAGKTRRATGRSPRNAQTAPNGVPASEDKGHPDGTARHTQRRKRGAGRGKQGRHNTRHRPPAPRTGHERRTHTTRALHLSRQ